MTEAEWLACRDVDRMLKFLKGKASDRKLRWFAIACCRRIGYLIIDDASKEAVDAAEWLADGLATNDELWDIRDSADLAATDHDADDDRGSIDSREAALMAMEPVAFEAATCAWTCAMTAVGGWSDDPADRELQVEEQAAQADLLREIFGPLAFRQAPSGAPILTRSKRSKRRPREGSREMDLPPSLLAWDGGTIPKLAHGVYDDRAWDRLPVLADALEEAGCDEADILGHLRGPGPHVRGCWVVDLLTGKS